MPIMSEKQSFKHKAMHFYESNYKKLLLIPFILLVLAFVQIGVQYSVTGDFVNKGVSLKGGSTITIDHAEEINPDSLAIFLSGKFSQADISVRTLGAAGQPVAYAVDSDAQTTDEIDALLEAIGQEVILDDNYSVEVIGSSLGESFFRQTATALLIAFILMGIVVFIYFRNPAPTLAVILAAFSDIVVTISIFNLTGIKLSTAGIAAFLMLIGYSVDTDILLSNRVLKRDEGSVMDRVYGAMGTGLTMSFTTLSAVSVALFFVKSDVVQQIMLILIIGLLVDLVMTWIQNVGILRLYLEKKK
jgi:preprotein translocase subunit SecF